MIKLHDYILSADCYKIRLMLSMLGLPWKPVKVDIHPGREHRSPAFLDLNPFGEIPVLEDGEVTIRKASAILVYLAKRYDDAGNWLPADAAGAAQVVSWLAFSEQELAAAGRLRMAAITARRPAPDDRSLAQRALQIFDDHLAAAALKGHDWMVGAVPTIADVAAFPCAALAPDAELQLNEYPAVWRWIARFKELQGFVVMPGVLPTFAEVF